MPKKTLKSQWTRNCPNSNCNNILYYSSKRNLQRAIANGKNCNECRKPTDEQKQKISTTLTGRNIKRSAPDVWSEKKFFRICPVCGEKIGHTRKDIRDRQEKINSSCNSCKSSNKNLIKNFFRNCPGCGKELGYSRKDTMDRAEKDNSICNSCSTKIYQKGVMGGLTEAQTKQMRATKAGFKDWEEYQRLMPEKKKYKAEVWKITYRQPIKDLKNFDKRGRCGVEGAYQIDHIISVSEGFKKEISPDVIGDISNIRMIPWKENLLKSNN